jgi:hypothetical protein
MSFKVPYPQHVSLDNPPTWHSVSELSVGQDTKPAGVSLKHENYISYVVFADYLDIYPLPSYQGYFVWQDNKDAPFELIHYPQHTSLKLEVQSLFPLQAAPGIWLTVPWYPQVYDASLIFIYDRWDRSINAF